MTYNETKREINRLWKEYKNAYTFEQRYERANVCYGHGDFRPTDRMEWKTYKVDDVEKQAELKKQIDALYKTIEAEDEKRKIIAKVKRYEKQVEELKKELEYKENFIKKYKNLIK